MAGIFKAGGLLTPADKILIVLIAVAAVAGILLKTWLYPAPARVTALISVHGKIVKTIELRQGYHEMFEVREGHHFNLIEAKDGRIRVQEADCPDRICILTGWISVPPQQIVCLPNQVVIRLQTSSAVNDVDEITR